VAQLLREAGCISKPRNIISKVKISSRIVSGDYPVVLLLGGACGTGKSTLASALSSQMRIGDVISTDTVRHILRGLLPRKGHEALFGSTYDVLKELAPADYPDLYALKDSRQRVVSSFYLQARLVQQHLAGLIAQFVRDRRPLVLEGVHLTPDFMADMFAQHKTVFPFLIVVNKEEKHKERFFVRAKEHTLDPAKNKYVANIDNIRIIHAETREQACLKDVPVVANGNFDKTVGYITKAIIKFIKRTINQPKKTGTR
jgi:2-phosphoglycerate kinase